MLFTLWPRDGRHAHMGVGGRVRAVEGVDPVVSYPVAGMNRVMLIWAGDGTWHHPGALVFEWDLAHAVTVYRDGAKVDSFPVGDPAKSTTSSRHVQRVCREYLDAQS
jgi:hypothetical protein